MFCFDLFTCCFSLKPVLFAFSFFFFFFWGGGVMVITVTMTIMRMISFVVEYSVYANFC